MMHNLLFNEKPVRSTGKGCRYKRTGRGHSSESGLTDEWGRLGTILITIELSLR